MAPIAGSQRTGARQIGSGCPAQRGAAALGGALSRAGGAPQLDGRGGVYCENCDIAPVISERIGAMSMADGAHLRGVMPYAVDPKRLLGLTFL